MNRLVLTERYVRARKPAKPGTRPIVWDALVPGFGIRSTDKSHSYGIWARFGGSKHPTWRAIGDVRTMSLADARQTARVWLDLTRKGIDPRHEKERQRRAELQKQANTFEAVAEAFITKKLPSERKGEEVKKDIRRDLIPAWGSMPASEITDREVASLIEAKSKVTPAQARNLLGIVKRLFRWAAQPHRRQEYGLTVSPCADLKPKDLDIGEKVSGDRTLTDDEIFALARAARRMPYPYGPVYQLLLLSALRLNEVVDASWPEFDRPRYRFWEIPASRMKGMNAGKKQARPHVVPITDEIRAILEGLPRFNSGPYLFSTTFGAKPIWIGSKIKQHVDKRMLRTLRALARLRGDDPTRVTLPRWVNHDIRRSVRSNLSRLRIAEEVREALLAHVRPGIKGTYDKHNYFDEKQDGLQQWAKRLREITEPAPDNVLKLPARA
jgi:integrase